MFLLGGENLGVVFLWRRISLFEDPTITAEKDGKGMKRVNLHRIPKQTIEMNHKK